MARRIAEWIAFLALACAAAALARRDLWAVARDGVEATWIGVAAGAESLGLFGSMTIWEAARDVLLPEAATFVALAPVLPFGFAGATLLFATLAGAAVRYMATDVGAPPLAASATGVLAAVLWVGAADGLWSVVAAAPLLWVVALAAGRERPWALWAVVLLLALSSRGGLLLAIPFLTVSALVSGVGGQGRRGLWFASFLAAAAAFAAGESEPPWAHYLRSLDSDALLPEGPYALAEHRLEVALRSPAFGSVVGALLLWASGVAGAFRGNGRAPRLLVAALAFCLLPIGDVERFAGPARFLAEVVPSLRFYPVETLAAALALGLVLPLFAAALPTALVAAICALSFAATVFVAHPRPAGVALVVPPAALDGAKSVLVLPDGPARALVVRRAHPANPALRNGTQAQLDRGAALIARELPMLAPVASAAWLRRAGVERVVVSDSGRLPLGHRRFSVGDLAVIDLRVRDAAALEGEARCLPPVDWRFASSGTDPAVSRHEHTVDGRLDTRWGSAAPQRPGMYFEIHFPEVLRLEELRLSMGPFTHDRPRGLRAFVGGPGDEPPMLRFERSPYRGPLAWNPEGRFAFEDGEDDLVRVLLGGVRADRVRLELTRSVRPFDWSIAEVCVVGEAIAAPGLES